MNRAALAIAAAVIALTGCGSTTGSATDAAPSSTLSPSQFAAPSPAPCTTNACIAQDVQQDAVGMVAADSSVTTAAKCKPSTVKHNAGNTWTVQCVVTYSDGSKVPGRITPLPDKNRIAFQPDGT